MRKHTEYLLARAKMAQRAGNYEIARRLQDTAKQFENRAAVIPQGLPLFSVPLKSTHGASIMADRITAKLDCCDYGFACEPGYDEDVIRVFYNWNNAEKQSGIIERLNQIGCPIEAEWSDQWTSCSICGRYVRTQPDGYSWLRSYAEINYDTICHECIKGDPELYIEYLVGEPKRANTILSSECLTELGWKCFAERQENGLHGGQAKEPAKIARWLREHGVNEFLFNLDCVGQFDSEFSVWVKQDCELTPPEHEYEWNGVDLAEVAKAMLRQR